MKAFIARQPIFTKDQRIWAYELLFRHGPQNWFDGMDPDRASSAVISNSAGLFDLSSLTGGHPAFINLPRQLILDGSVRLLPPEQAVVEVLEDVEPDDEIVAAVRGLKQEGYRIALDDIVDPGDQVPLQPVADIIKIDLKGAGHNRSREIIHKLRRHKLRFLAEKVETWADYQEAKDMGFTLFQGYYFQKPEILSQKDIPHNKHIALRLIREVRKPELDYSVLESLIKEDLALTYRLLRLVNSAWAALPREIVSVGHAMVMLGETRVRQLVQMTALGHMGEDGNEELVQRSFVRAHFLESLAGNVSLGMRDQELYFIGLFSWLDTLLGKSMQDILKLLPVGEEAQLALVERSGPLSPLLLVCDALENGNWESFDWFCQNLGLQSATTSELYIRAMETVYHLHSGQFDTEDRPVPV